MESNSIYQAMDNYLLYDKHMEVAEIISKRQDVDVVSQSSTKSHLRR